MWKYKIVNIVHCNNLKFKVKKSILGLFWFDIDPFDNVEGIYYTREEAQNAINHLMNK